MKVTYKCENRVRLSGCYLRAGEVYRDAGGSIVMCTDESSVVCMKTGTIMEFMVGEGSYVPVTAELVLS